MSEKQERRRSLSDMLITISVGGVMLTNVFETTEKFYKMGEKIAPGLQEYVGTVGSDVVEYGLPVLANLVTVTLGIIAVNATDKYLLNKGNLERK